MPAGPTYEPLANVTLSSAQSSITFSSIPSTYTDLRVVLVANNPTSDDSFGLRFNSTTTGYSETYLQGNGSSATSSRDTSSSLIYAGIINTGSYKGLYTYDIFNYAGSTYKTVLGTWSTDTNGTASDPYNNAVGRIVGLWQNTAAITTVTIMNTTFSTGTTATLYGIKAA